MRNLVLFLIAGRGLAQFPELVQVSVEYSSAGVHGPDENTVFAVSHDVLI